MEKIAGSVFRVLKKLFVALFLVVCWKIVYGQTGRQQTKTGKELAMQHCRSCHGFTDPSLLDKKTWREKVLPNMGWRLGIREPGVDPYADTKATEADAMRALSVYPEQPLIKAEEWSKIVAYFIGEAPEHPDTAIQYPAQGYGATLFEAVPISIGEKQAPKTSLLKYDQKKQLLYIGDAENELYILDRNLQMAGFWQVSSPPVDIDFPTSAPPRVLCIGSVAPSEEKTGALFALDTLSSNAQGQKPFTALGRPVQFSAGDLDGDGTEDLLIAAFGNHSGKLALYGSSDPGQEKILKLQPGARKTIVKDMDGDGKPDILAMMTQARESLLLFTNLGGGEFEERVVATFPPVYGLSHMELADFNQDGYDDILLTNGDNWDLSAIRKKYHGLRILLNDGKNQFTESLFIPLYGASKAMAHDFDKDGDLDIAAISFYDDPEDPSSGFVFYENQGGMDFTQSMLKETSVGKWLTMEICDIDQDNDMDIVLGSYFHNASEVTKLLLKGINGFPQVVVLKNLLQ